MYLLVHGGIATVVATAAALGAADALFLAVVAVFINAHAAHHPSQIRHPFFERVAGAIEHAT